jgi:glycosyltransferase involved in cell wall biosynthesis
VAEEYGLWGVRRPSSDPRDTVREEAIYAGADAITVPSQAAARSFVEMGVPPAKIHVIPYGVRLESFRQTAEPTAGEFNVLFAGSGSLRKGVPYLLQAFAAVRHPRKRLRIAGGLQQDLRSVLGRLPTAQVEFLGPVPKPKLIEYMNRSDVLVLPSIEEGFGLVVPEAMACGCPVICSANVGGADMVTDGVDGFIVPIRDPAALTDRMMRLADDPGLAQSMRAAALSRVQRIGGWTQYGDQWEALLRGLLAAR